MFRGSIDLMKLNQNDKNVLIDFIILSANIIQHIMKIQEINYSCKLYIFFLRIVIKNQ